MFLLHIFEVSFHILFHTICSKCASRSVGFVSSAFALPKTGQRNEWLCFGSVRPKFILDAFTGRKVNSSRSNGQENCAAFA